MFIRELHQWNSLLCLLLALLFNTLLIWLVLKRSPKELRPYSRILLQTCIVDIALACMTELTQPIMFTHQGAAIVFLNGPLIGNLDSPTARFTFFTIWMLIFYMAIFGLCVQFLYRYLILIKNASISFPRYISMLVVPFSIQIATNFVEYFIGCPTEQNSLLADAHISQMLIDSWEPIKVAMNVPLGLPIYILAAVSFIEYLACYSVIFYSGYAMVKHVSENAKILNRREEMQSLNRQITRNLIILAAMPLSLLCINSVCIGLIMFTTNSLTVAGMLTTIPVEWLPALNPLVTMFTIHPYRRAIIAFGKNVPTPTTEEGAANGGAAAGSRVTPAANNSEIVGAP